MPLLETIRQGDARIAIWEITESSEELAGLLSNRWIVDEVLMFKNEKRRREYLAARIALKSLLKHELEIVYTEDGKPVAADGEFNISISHSHNRVAVICDRNFEVGIDIELQQERLSALASRFLSRDEQLDFAGNNFLGLSQVVWSAKEALYKIVGKQAVDFASSFRVFSFELRAEGLLKAECRCTNKGYELHYLQKQGYTLVYCIDK